ncbi:hypothetical protein TRVL_02477 [Trypanosoma vivax]|nr:hypothetical protein TRVL_02477 [Trypanosoma vivax]
MSVSSTVSLDGSVAAELTEFIQLQSQRHEELLRRLCACESRIRALEELAVNDKGGIFSSSGNDRSVIAPNVELQEAAVVEQNRLCDYCLVVTRCRMCFGCGREWYCSSPCRRLRSYVHNPVCCRRR